LTLLARYRDWNRYAYLSRFERRLNRALWALLIVGVVYAVLQHVVLANVPEIFHAGARWGDLLYDLAIAYVGAFTFYLLNIRLPLRRDRRNVYQSLGPLISRIVGQAVQLMGHLNRAAGVSANRVNTLDNVEDICSRLTLSSATPNYAVPVPGGFRIATVADLLRDYKEQTRRLSAELLSFTSYLASELIDYIVAIEHRGYFGIFDQVTHATAGEAGDMPDIRWLARPLFDYLQLVERVDKYHRHYRRAFIFEPGFLVSGTRKGSDATPLLHAQ
jgi:hypothetical protein